MIDLVDTLILDLLEWVASGERSYAEVMDAWRTSCPGFRCGRMRTIAVSSRRSGWTGA